MTISGLTLATNGWDSAMNSIIEAILGTSTYGFGAMTFKRCLIMFFSLRHPLQTLRLLGDHLLNPLFIFRIQAETVSRNNAFHYLFSTNSLSLFNVRSRTLTVCCG